MATNPMHQFEVYRIGPEIKIGDIDISFTNASLFMIISSLAILIVFSLGSKRKSLIPDKMQLLSELSYSFVSKIKSSYFNPDAVVIILLSIFSPNKNFYNFIPKIGPKK